MQIEDTGDDFNLNAETGLTCDLRRCEWTPPNQNYPCIIDKDVAPNDVLSNCGGSDIIFTGKRSCSLGNDDCIESCDIEVRDADSKHEGMWVLKAIVGQGTGNSYTDNINVTFAGRIIGNRLGQKPTFYPEITKNLKFEKCEFWEK